VARGRGQNGELLTEGMLDRIRRTIEWREGSLAALQSAHFVLPSITFDDSIQLHRGRRTLRLIHYPGHTDGDLAVYLPGDRVLISGDLADDMPYAGHGSPARLAATLDSLARLDAAVVIPGHGSVRRGNEHLLRLRDLFRSVVAQAEAAVRAGDPPDRAVEALKLEPFRAQIAGDDPVYLEAFDSFARTAFERAYDEAKTGPRPGARPAR
jgi:glyoxylase-like metal-dependent hydrolase (beta-lactamase superfamily II)